LNRLALLIDKTVVIVLFFLMFIDSFPGVEIHLIAFLVPLLITGTLRCFMVTLVLIMDLISLTNEGSKKIFKRNKNKHKS